MEFRVAIPEDNDAILALADRCPQEGMISFTVHRKPQFDTLLKILDPDSWHYVACHGNKVVGLIGVVHFKALLNGEPRKCAYMMDFRVDPSYRSSTVTYRLVKGAVDRILKSDADFAIGIFLKSNNKPTVFASGRAGFPPGYHMGDNKVFNIIPWRKLRIDQKYTVRVAKTSDIPRLVRLYQEYANSFRLAPQLDEQRFRSIIESTNGLSIDRFWLACEGEIIRAVSAVWDEHYYRHYQVQRVTPQIKWANRIVRTIGKIRAMPKPIELNQALRQQSLVLYAHDGDAQALSNVFRHIQNEQMSNEYTLLSLYTRDNDPIIPHLSGFTGINVTSVMYMFANDRSLYEGLMNSDSIDWLDLSVVI